MKFPLDPTVIFCFALIIMLHALNSPAYTQSTGEIDYPSLGIKFTIPEGWKGQEVEEGYFMGSDTEPGFIFLMTHEAKNLDELRAGAEEGINEEGGTQSTLSKPLNK